VPDRGAGDLGAIDDAAAAERHDAVRLGLPQQGGERQHILDRGMGAHGRRLARELRADGGAGRGGDAASCQGPGGDEDDALALGEFGRQRLGDGQAVADALLRRPGMEMRAHSAVAPASRTTLAQKGISLATKAA
jgi:hypothetical protein